MHTLMAHMPLHNGTYAILYSLIFYQVANHYCDFLFVQSIVIFFAGMDPCSMICIIIGVGAGGVGGLCLPADNI